MYILWPSFIYGLPKRTQAATGEHRYRDRPTHTYSCDAAATAAADAARPAFEPLVSIEIRHRFYTC